MQTATVSCTEQIQVNIKERGAVREDFHITHVHGAVLRFHYQSHFCTFSLFTSATYSIKFITLASAPPITGSLCQACAFLP